MIKKLGIAQHDHPFGCESPEVVEKINEIIDFLNKNHEQKG